MRKQERELGMLLVNIRLDNAKEFGFENMGYHVKNRGKSFRMVSV
jgi:hypothetical protein